MFSENDVVVICHPSGTSPESIELIHTAKGSVTFQREQTCQFLQLLGPSFCDSGHLATAYSAPNLQLLTQRIAHGERPSLCSLRADPETKMWVQVVYLGGDAREHSERMQANMSCVEEQVGNSGSIMLGTFGKTVRNIPWNCPQWKAIALHSLAHPSPCHD